MKQLVFQVWKSCLQLPMAILYTIHLVPENVDFGILYYDILLTFWINLLCVIVLLAAILDAILNLTHSARDPDCPPKFSYLPRVHYQDQESKWGTSDCTQDPPQPQNYTR